MSARDNWGQVAHNLRVLAGHYELVADSIDAAIDTPSSEAATAAGASSPQAPAARPLQEQHVAAALGVCPVHRTAWTVKAGGISKAGKPYRAFHKCNGKNDDGSYCDQKPVKAWVDTHPIVEEVPF
jgi:protein gp37